MRLIDADALIQVLCVNMDTGQQFDRATHCVDVMPTVDAIPQWIPCSERLPEEEKDVLVTVHFKGLKQKHRTGWIDYIKETTYVEVARLEDGVWRSDSEEYKVAKERHEVVAWMPLPKPYEVTA